MFQPALSIVGVDVVLGLLFSNLTSCEFGWLGKKMHPFCQVFQNSLFIILHRIVGRLNIVLVLLLLFSIGSFVCSNIGANAS